MALRNAHSRLAAIGKNCTDFRREQEALEEEYVCVCVCVLRFFLSLALTPDPLHLQTDTPKWSERETNSTTHLRRMSRGCSSKASFTTRRWHNACGLLRVAQSELGCRYVVYVCVFL